MSTTESIDRSLFADPQTLTDPRLERFVTELLWHPTLDAATGEALGLLGLPRPPRIVLLVGPTGVGKTRLVRGLVGVLNRRARAALETDRGRIEAAMVEADAPMGSVFTWPPLLRQILLELGEPSIGRKIVFRDAGRSDLIVHLDDKPNELFASTIAACRRRRLAVLAIDEGQHLSWAASPAVYLEQLERLKSFANRARLTIVLAGSYDLLRFADRSGQLLRRSAVVHLPRYRAERPEELAAFRQVLADLVERLPIPIALDTERHWQDAYERSIGCVGLLHDWLANALALALGRGAERIGPTDLRVAARAARDLRRLLREAQANEEFEATEALERRELRKALGLTLARRPAEPTAEPTSEASPTDVPPAHPSAARRVGERSPRRDPVGAGVGVAQ